MGRPLASALVIAVLVLASEALADSFVGPGVHLHLQNVALVPSSLGEVVS